MGAGQLADTLLTGLLVWFLGPLSAGILHLLQESTEAITAAKMSLTEEDREADLTAT